MTKFRLIMVLAFLLGGIILQPAYGQGRFLKKLKNKAEDKAVEKIFGEDKESPESAAAYDDSNSPANTKGGGLTKEPPDVMANIGEAESAFGNKEYADARFAVRQAIMGIELEVGNDVLRDLPGKINGLEAVQDEDMVASTGIGFAGLIIERTYRDGDKQFKVTVANESVMLNAVNMYLASGGAYASSTDDNHKIVTYNDERAVLEYDEYSGYKLSVPFGQSSILVTEGINFETENEIMAASEEINFTNIKKALGEE